jgi:DNA replication licensing factor MCM7
MSNRCVRLLASINDQPQLLIQRLTPPSFLDAQFEDPPFALAANISRNGRRYLDLFAEVVDSLLPEPSVDLAASDDVGEIIMEQRRRRNEEAGREEADKFPPTLTRR